MSTKCDNASDLDLEDHRSHKNVILKIKIRSLKKVILIFQDQIILVLMIKIIPISVYIVVC